MGKVKASPQIGQRIDFLAVRWMADFRSQIFLERLPVMRPPSRCQVRGCALGEAGMIEAKFRFGLLLVELESHHRIKTRRPISFAPCLHDALVGNKLDVATRYHASKNRERTTHFRANLRGSAFHNEIGDLAKLLLIDERFVNSLPRRLENNLLMDTLAGLRDPIPIGLRSRETKNVFRHSEYRQECREAHRKVSSRIAGAVHRFFVENTAFSRMFEDFTTTDKSLMQRRLQNCSGAVLSSDSLRFMGRGTDAREIEIRLVKIQGVILTVAVLQAKGRILRVDRSLRARPFQPERRRSIP